MSHGISLDSSVFVLLKGKNAKAKRVRRIKRSEAYKLVENNKANWLSKEEAKTILSDAKNNEEKKKAKKKK